VRITISGLQSATCAFYNDPGEPAGDDDYGAADGGDAGGDASAGRAGDAAGEPGAAGAAASTGAGPVADLFAWLLVIGLGSAVMLVTRMRRNER
jgi:hypothetical protein